MTAFDPTRVNTLARAFSRVLREWLTKEQMAEVIRRNELPEYAGACASHDFCDANMAMLEACQSLGIDMGQGQDYGLENSAWDEAKASGFAVSDLMANEYRISQGVKAHANARAARGLK